MIDITCKAHGVVSSCTLTHPQARELYEILFSCPYKTPPPPEWYAFAYALETVVEHKKGKI